MKDDHGVTLSSNRKYLRMVASYMLLIIIVSLIPMLLDSFIILSQFYTSYHEKVMDHLKELVLKQKQNIDFFLKEKLANIRYMALTNTFEQLSDEAFLQKRLAMLQQEYDPVFVDLGVINSQGSQLAYAGPFKLGKASYAEAKWFQEAIQTDYFISDVFLGLRGLPHFIITVRTFHKGEPWLLRATIDFVAFNTLVQKIRIGQTGFAFILNREGEVQTKLFQDLVPAGELDIPFLMREVLVTEDDVQIIQSSDGENSRYIYVTAMLKNGDWILVYRQAASDAFLSLKKTLVTSIIIIGLGLIGIFMMTWTLSRRIVRRIARGDQEKAMMNAKIVETGKLATVGELAAGVAHEINNPVAIMVEEAGWIGDLLQEEEFQESENLDELRRAVNQIVVQGRRCKEITHKLLSFARKTDSRVEFLQLNDLIREVVELSAQRARYAMVTINTALQAGIPKLWMSQSELQQVFLNLINNALDAMENKGGILNLTTKMSSDNQMIILEVRDTGSGIPESLMARIFDPFFTTKPVGKGTGLGLSICYGIIQKMGGDIVCESTIGEGTIFTIHLPVKTSIGTDDERGRIPSDQPSGN